MTRFLTVLFLMVSTAVSAQENYQVRPGDTLRVEVLEDSALTRNVVVLPDGRFSFPFAGTVGAGGRTLSQIERAVITAIASNFASEPNVFVSIVSLRPVQPVVDQPTPEPPPTISIFFVGEINTPGESLMAPGTTILQAFALNGGFTNFAALKRVQLRRTDRHTLQQRVFTINYKALADGAALSRDIVLEDGDIILVPERRLFE